MKALLVFLLLVLTVAARAEAPTGQEQAYVAARTTETTRLESIKGPEFDKENTEAIRALEPRLRAVLGAIAAPTGFSGAGQFHPEALCCELGAGALDGLAFGDGKAGVAVVTTDGLLRLWVGSDPATSLANDSFDYSGAFGADAAVTAVVPLPIRAPAGAGLAVARLATQCNGTCSLPDYLAVVVLTGGRARLALVRAALPPAPATDCDGVWQQAIARYREAYARFDADRSGPNAYQLLTAASRLEAEGGQAVQQCLRQDRGFPALTRQAQALADDLAR
jgi:hypothetical protein